MTRLVVDREQIALFVKTIFRHASVGQIIWMRAFYEGANKRPFESTFARANSKDLEPVIDMAERVAQKATDAPEPLVFCLLPAAFKDSANAKEENLSEGFVLCVECDSHPEKAQRELERVLGPATLIVESGGHWKDPDTGEIQKSVTCIGG